jgi:hypothetical protein
MQIDSREAEGGRDERSRLPTVGAEGFSVLVQLGVEASRPPAGEHGLDRGNVDLEEIGDRLQVRRQSDDRADVEIAIRPPVEAMTDPRREGVIHGGMTEGALQADGLEASVRVGMPGHADDGVELEQGERRRRVVEVHPPRPKLILERGRKRIHVDFQADRERGPRADASADAAESLAFDRLVKLKRVPPVGLVSEGVVPEYAAPLFERRLGVWSTLIVVPFARWIRPLTAAERDLRHGEERDQRNDHRDGPQNLMRLHARNLHAA